MLDQISIGRTAHDDKFTLILCQFIQILKDFLNKMSDFIPNFSLNLNMNRAEDELLYDMIAKIEDKADETDYE